MAHSHENPRLSATLLGFVTLLSWSTVVAFIRSLVEDLGPFLFLAITSGVGGLCLLMVGAVRQRSLWRPFQIKLSSLVWCGIPFVAYFILFAASLTLAKSRLVAVQVGLVNYLWPSLMLVLSVPLGGRRARWGLLVPGALLALGGAVLGSTRLDSLAALPVNLAANVVPFAMMLAGTACWALYSVLIGRPEHRSGALGVPLFHLLTGILALAFVGWTGGPPHIDRVSLPALAYMTLIPTALGYLGGEVGLKRGHYTLLNLASFALPIGATLFACYFLDVPLSLNLLFGAWLVFLGAYLSWRAFLV